MHLAVLLIFFVSTRLRVPLYLGLDLFAGYGLEWLFANRRKAPAWAGAALLIGLTVLGFVRDRPSVRERVRLAAVLSMENRLDEGLQVLQPVLQTPPTLWHRTRPAG